MSSSRVLVNLVSLMLEKFLPALVSVCLVVPTAHASDLSIKTPIKHLDSWSGLYFGGSMGGGMLASRHIPMDSNVESFTQAKTGSQLGPVGGVNVGYDFQMKSLVLGIVADANILDRTTKTDGNPDYVGSEARTNIGTYFTIRGRIGYELNSTDLIYGTAGVAFVNVKTGFDYDKTGFSCELDGPNPNYSACDKNKLETGLALGGGYETKLTDELTLDFQYLYVGLPTRLQATDSLNDGYEDFSMKFKPSIQTLKIGLNWHF